MLEKKNDHLKCPSWRRSGIHFISKCSKIFLKLNFEEFSILNYQKSDLLEIEMKIRICFFLVIPNWRINPPSDPEEDKNVIIFHSVWKSLKNLIWFLPFSENWEIFLVIERLRDFQHDCCVDRNPNSDTPVIFQA